MIIIYLVVPINIKWYPPFKQLEPDIYGTHSNTYKVASM